MTERISQGYPLWVSWMTDDDLPRDVNESGSVQVAGTFDPDMNDFQSLVSEALNNCGRVVGWECHDDVGTRPIVAKDGKVSDGVEDLLDSVSLARVFYGDTRRTSVLRMMDHVYGVFDKGGKLPDGWQDVITSIVIY